MSNNQSIYIDPEALSTLALLQAGMTAPICKLMNKEESEETNRTKLYKGVTVPFSSTLAPKGKRNRQVLKTLKRGDVTDLISEGKKVGEIIVDETYEIDPMERLENIYGTRDPSHPGVNKTMKRLGDIAICGELSIDYPLVDDNLNRVTSFIKKHDSKFVTSLVLSANPLNRAHEYIIRQAISQCDLLVIFLRKPFVETGLRYDIRHTALQKFVNNFLPLNKVLIIPFESAYIFAGYNELLIDAMIAKNHGCQQLVIGKNHGGLGLHYNDNKLQSIFDGLANMGIHIKTVDECVYCEVCETLVGVDTCPHGQHHHIHYHGHSILKLIKTGIVPPSILMRKEVSAHILSSLFPERFEGMQELYYSLMPNTGLLETPSEEEFYLKLLALYQISSPK